MAAPICSSSSNACGSRTGFLTPLQAAQKPMYASQALSLSYQRQKIPAGKPYAYQVEGTDLYLYSRGGMGFPASSIVVFKFCTGSDQALAKTIKACERVFGSIQHKISAQENPNAAYEIAAGKIVKASYIGKEYGRSGPRAPRSLKIEYSFKGGEEITDTSGFNPEAFSLFEERLLSFFEERPKFRLPFQEVLKHLFELRSQERPSGISLEAFANCLDRTAKEAFKDKEPAFRQFAAKKISLEEFLKILSMPKKVGLKPILETEEEEED